MDTIVLVMSKRIHKKAIQEYFVDGETVEDNNTKRIWSVENQQNGSALLCKLFSVLSKNMFIYDVNDSCEEFFK